MENYKRVCAKINLNNIKENYLGMVKVVGSQSRFFAVIKADGYGHGAVEIAKMLEKEDSLYGFAVATAEEALELRNHGITKPILVLGYTFPDSYEKLAYNNIMPTVFREDSLAELSAAAKKTGHIIKAHIKVDTGMHRIGIAPNESGLDFVEKLLATEGVELEGMFTHFARADEFDKSDALRQNKIFQDFVSEVEERFQIQIPYKHSANSAGILELKDSYLDLVRAGVALYGMWPSEEVSKEIVQLKPALSLYSHVVYIKEIRKGDAVSYGGTFVAEKNMRVATIPVGYGDGYPRSLSGKGYVLIRGKKAPILGRVCMDQFMVDVTEIPEAQMDDLVTLIGTDGDLEITIEELGDISGRFNYELACDLGKRIPRVYNL
jgi:alanine racemase